MSVSLKKSKTVGNEAAVIDNAVSTKVAPTEGTKAMKTPSKAVVTEAPVAETAPVAAPVVNKEESALKERFHVAHAAFVDTLFGTYKHCSNPALAAELKEEIVAHFEEMKFVSEKLSKFEIIIRKAARNMKNIERGSELAKAMKAAAKSVEGAPAKGKKAAKKATEEVMNAAAEVFGEAPLSADL